MRKIFILLAVALIAFSANAADWTLSDPGADRIVGWDDSNTGAEVSWFTLGTGLTVTDTTIAVDAELAAIAGLTFADASIVQLTGAAAAAVLTSGGNNYFLKSTSDNSALEFAVPTFASFTGQTAWRVFYSNGDGDVTELALGSDGEYLKSNGAAAAPSWATPSGAAHDAVTLSAAAGSNLLSLSTQEIGLDTQTANYVFAGPTSGDPAAPAFRALGASDIPDLSGTYLTSLTAGTYIDVSGSTINVDLTETDDITWGAAAGGSQTWTFDTGAGTDPTMAIDETTGFTFNKPVVATSFSTGSSADPTLTLSDSDNAAGTAKIYGISGGGDNDIIMYLGVEIAGTTTDFIEIDGVSETVDVLKPLALGANNLTMSGSLATTGARVTKGWFTDIESTNMPTVGGTALLTSLTAPQFTTIELGHASDSTLSRSAGGVLAIEGVDLVKITSTQTLDFGGATLEIPNSDDPDTSVTGQVSFDTDGWMRVYNNSRQEALARVQEEIHVTVYKPQDLDDAQRDHFWIWSNESGMSFIVTGWKGWSTSDDTTLTIYEEDADGANDATVDAVEIATGSGPYTGSDTTITGATIENGHLIYLDFDDTDAPAMVKLTIYGYYNADVN